MPALIAVLPFSARRQGACVRFADGLTREVIHELGRSERLQVFSGQARSRPKAQIAALLTGTVQKSGSRLRVTTELLSTGNHRNLWSARFESGPSDRAIAQKQIAFATAHALVLHFAREP